MTKPVHMALCGLALTMFTGQARADLPELKWASEGYFRTRAVFLTNLAPTDSFTLNIYDNNYGNDQDLSEVTIPEIRRTSYVSTRLRLMPRLYVGKVASLHMQVDILDDVLWGDNNGIATTPLLAQAASTQGIYGGDAKRTVEVPRVWMQFQVPVGIMRVGRLASHWGMGLLANGGGTANLDYLMPSPAGQPERKSLDHFFDDDFGDNHFGSTSDKALFITKPITIVKTLLKKKDTTSPLIAAYAFGKISESPILPAEGYATRFRPFGQQGFITRGRDDVDEHTFLLAWMQPDLDRFAVTDALYAGVYATWRRSGQGSTYPSDLDPDEFCGTFGGEAVPCVDTGSSLWIFDAWWRLRLGPWYTEAEFMKIAGKTFGGIPFPGKNRKKEADLLGGVLRVGYMTDTLDGILEVGHAPGDDELEDDVVKQLPFHPDFNVGLILFEEILRELSARTYGLPFISEENPDGAVGLASKGGVINSNYIQPKVRWRPSMLRGVEVVGAALFAWVDTLARTGTAMFYADENSSSYLGTEFDVAVKAHFSRNMYFSLESGLLLFGPVLKSALENADTSFSLQSRIAFMW